MALRTPPPGSRLMLLRTIRGLMKLIALSSIAVAATAIILVMRGDRGPQIQTLVVVALGAGISVLLTGLAMSVFFLRRRGECRFQVSRFEKDQSSE